MVAPDESPPTAPSVNQLPERGPIEIIFGESIDPADIPGLCAAVGRGLAAGGAEFIICDVGSILEPDAVLIDALARLKLTAGRLGRKMCLRNASHDLLDLVWFVGLSDTMPLDPGSGSRRDQGQPEEREQVRGIQEEADPADSAV